MANVVIQYGLPQIGPDQFTWIPDVMPLDERFPKEFLELHHRLTTQDFDVLWCFTEVPERSQQDIAEKLRIKLSAVDHSSRAIRREWQSGRSTAVAIWKVCEELNEMREARVTRASSARNPIERRWGTG